MLALGQTGFGTGGGDGGIGHLGVTQRVDLLLCGQNLITYGAMLALGQTGFGTGGSDGGVGHLGVTSCLDALRFFFTTVTGALTYTLLGASRLLDCRPVTPSMGMLGQGGFRFRRTLRVRFGNGRLLDAGIDSIRVAYGCRRILRIAGNQYREED